MKNKMIAFLTNNWLTISLAIVPPLLVWYVLERQSPALTLTLRSSVPVVTIDKGLSEGIQILYRSKPVFSVDVIEIALENTGNRSIERSDFDSPLRIIFSASEVTIPDLVDVKPASLKPDISRDSLNSISISPLLLNEKDLLVFRTILLNRTERANLPFSVNARIRGVRDIQVQGASSANDSIRLFPLIFVIISGFVSITSLIWTLKRVQQLKFGISLTRAEELRKQIQTETSTTQNVKRLAEDLNISQHDYKANIALLRIKLESQLREIARRLQLPLSNPAISVSRLATELNKRGVLPHEITAAIADLLPVINREMHTIDSYLTDMEFDSLQNLALGVVAALDKFLKQPRGKGF